VKALIAGGGTAGHLTPAIAVAEALREAGWSVVLVGASRGIEAKLLPARGFPFHLLPAEPLYRREWWRNARWPWIAWRLVRAADRVLGAEVPEVVFGTGGYAAGPIVWRAARRGIATAIHESNASPGLATRLLARVVRHIYLGVPEAALRLRPGKHTSLHVTGNPIRPPRPIAREAARSSLGLTAGPLTLLVTGGSQGARALNEAVAAALDQGRLANTNIVWCTGHAHRETWAPYATPGRIVVTGFLASLDEAYAAADLALCRAGAFTCAELAAWGLPAVFVPLPTAAGQHQLHNARAAERAGAAVVLEEQALTGGALADHAEQLLRSPERRARMASLQRSRAHPGALAEVVSKISTLLA